MKIRSNIRLNIFTMIFSIIFPLLVTGCSGVPGKLLVIQANFHNSQGRYNDAIAAYLKALEYEEAAPYAEYGLGSVYYSLGEEKASLERFSESLRLLDTFPENINRELRYRIHYNTGIVLFSGGDFGGAAVSFREALRADGGKIEAKRNLELSLKAKNRESTSNRENSGDTEKQNESKAVLMEYMRQKEINQWKSRTWPEEEDITGPDY